MTVKTWGRYSNICTVNMLYIIDLSGDTSTMTSIVTEPSQDKHHSSNFSNLTTVQFVFIKLMVLVPIPGGFKDVDHVHQEKTLKVLKVNTDHQGIQVSPGHLPLRDYCVYHHWRTHFIYTMYQIFQCLYIYILCNIRFLCGKFVRIPQKLQSSFGPCMPQFAVPSWERRERN